MGVQKTSLLGLNIGMALDGGGGRGGFQAGVLYELQKHGITASEVSCISVGALNGILVATGQYELMKAIWFSVTDDMVRKPRGTVRYAWRFLKHKIGVQKPLIGFWENEPLKALVRKSILGKTTEIDYYAGSVNAKQDEFIHYRIEAGTEFTEENVDEFVDWIVSSTAIPGVFTPVYRDNMMLVDGGIHHQSPIKPISEILSEDIDMVLGISMKPERHFIRPQSAIRAISDDVEMIAYVIDSLLTQNFWADRKTFMILNEICLRNGGSAEILGKTYTYYASLFIHPTKQLSPSTRFHHKYAKPDFEHGVEIISKLII